MDGLKYNCGWHRKDVQLLMERIDVQLFIGRGGCTKTIFGMRECTIIDR